MRPLASEDEKPSAEAVVAEKALGRVADGAKTDLPMITNPA